MTFLRRKMGMLTVLILVIVKGTDGPPVTILPNIEPTVIIINACAGEKKELMTKDESAQGDILTPRWIFSNRSFSATNYVTYCQKETSGTFTVNPIYESKVEQCNTTSIFLKNLSLDDMGYYKLQFLKGNLGKKETLPIFLSVSDTPTKQCKPVISNYSRNMLNCSTQCEQFDVEWRLSKEEAVVGNESILEVHYLCKNESILCCLKSKAMECYKGNRSDLCTQTTPSYCTENKPGENGHVIHADKAPDNPGNNMLGLLALLIIPGIAVVIYVLHQKKILSFPTMCQDTCKSIPGRSVSTQETRKPKRQLYRKTDLRKKENRHKYSFGMTQAKCSDFKNNDTDTSETSESEEAISEKPSFILGRVQELDADLRLDQIQVETSPMHLRNPEPHADVNDVQVPEKPSFILGRVQELDADLRLDQIQGVPQPVQVTSHRDSPDSASYRLMWNKPDDGGFPLIKYIIQYCEVEINPNEIEYELSKPLSQLVTAEILPPDVSYLLAPLKPGSYYQVEVQAVNTMGMSSERFIFKTKKSGQFQWLEQHLRMITESNSS